MPAPATCPLGAGHAAHPGGLCPLPRSAKQGKGVEPVALEEARVVSSKSSPDLVAIDEALKSLSHLDARKSQVVEMRFFGGLTVEETAEVLKVSPKTVRRDWQLAKVWLVPELSGSGKIKNPNSSRALAFLAVGG